MGYKEGGSVKLLYKVEIEIIVISKGELVDGGENLRAGYQSAI